MDRIRVLVSQMMYNFANFLRKVAEVCGHIGTCHVTCQNMHSRMTLGRRSCRVWYKGRGEAGSGFFFCFCFFHYLTYDPGFFQTKISFPLLQTKPGLVFLSAYESGGKSAPPVSALLCQIFGQIFGLFFVSVSLFHLNWEIR